MRRITTGLLLFLALVGTFLVLPVVSAQVPAPKPVPTSTEQLALGSIGAPAPAAEVRLGTTAAVTGVPQGTPTLSLTRTDVPSFSLVGVTWTFDPAVTDTLVQVRVQDSAGAWGSWTSVGSETADQGEKAPGATLRGGTSPLWTGPSTGVQVELVTRAGAQPTDIRLDLVDPGTSAADASLGAPDITGTAHAAMAMPPVYSRAQWGADESIRTWDPQYAPTIKAATLHHTADTNNYTADQVPAMLRAMYGYHTVSLGWGDIGYNVIVDKFGRLFEGRYGGLASTVIGAHAGGFNYGTFGVSMLGNYDVVDTPQPMIDSVSAIIAWKFALYGVDPNAMTTLTAYHGAGTTAKVPDGTALTVPTIFGHRDVGKTACPGRYGYARLPEIRQQVTARLAASRSPIQNRYWTDDGLRASLGAPVGTEQSAGGVNWQVFAGGRLYSSAAGGVRVVRGAILDTYLAIGGPAVLGAPVTDDARSAGGAGYFVRFQGGDIYWGPATGAQVVRGAILTAWLGAGGSGGPLGLPTTSDARTADGNGFVVQFQGGHVYWSPAGGAQIVRGGILDTWLAAGGTAGGLGFPVSSDARTTDGKGYFVDFQGGSVYWSAASGTRIVRGAILSAWQASGGSAGPLGFPVTSDARTADGNGWFVDFQGGSVYWSAATDAQIVRGGILTTWKATGDSGGPLGYPRTSDATTPDRRGWFVDFQGGSVYSSPASGTHVVRGAILSAWQAAGGVGGALGFPTSSDAPTPDGHGYFVDFQGGSVYWSAATGTQIVRGGILAAWRAAGGSGGGLGFPTSSEAPTPDGHGYFVDFQGGSVYWSPSTGPQIVRGAILGLWRYYGGSGGFLGFPTTSDAAAPGGGYVVDFEGGSVYWSPATGAHSITGPLATSYTSRGRSGSALGFPVADSTYVTGGMRSDFQHGSMTWASSSGVVTVSP